MVMKRLKEKLKLIWLNTSFYFLFILFSTVSIPLLTLSIVLLGLISRPRTTMRRYRRAISWYGSVIINVLPAPLVRIRYKDYEKGYVKGPCLFICNHVSSSDPFLMACLPYECIQVVNSWPFKLPVLGIYARFAGYLSVNEMQYELFSQKACELLEQGVSIISFPEGTRSGSSKMGQFHSSIMHIALKSRCPVIPICIWGNQKIPSKGSLVFHPGTIRVHKLRAMYWEEYRHLSPFQLKNRVRKIIADEVALLEEKSAASISG